MAAQLACGPDCALSHDAGAFRLGIRAVRPALLEVSVVGNRRGHDGVLVHRVATLEAFTFEGMRVTTAARTLADLAPRLDDRQLARAAEQAQILGLATHAELAASLPSRSSRLLYAGPQLTRSEAERRFLDLIERARLPRPRTNVRIGRYEVDLLWPEQRLIVEVDGYAFHSTRAAFERDRARDAELIAAGYRVIRVTWRQLVEEPEATVALLAGALRP
jgi:very-short-patch-repair endonuclease